jgi:hypothetical protein
MLRAYGDSAIPSAGRFGLLTTFLMWKSHPRRSAKPQERRMAQKGNIPAVYGLVRSHQLPMISESDCRAHTERAAPPRDWNFLYCAALDRPTLYEA